MARTLRPSMRWRIMWYHRNSAQRWGDSVRGASATICNTAVCGVDNPSVTLVASIRYAID
jgi:hypothetical protein